MSYGKNLQPVKITIQKPANLYESKLTTPRKLIAEYELLCNRYLPVNSDDIWRLSHDMDSESPNQGWKIHIAATLLSATTILEKTAPFLKSQKVVFKAPKSLIEVGKLNSGVFYGYTQIGKFLTVYPEDDEEFVYLTKKLHALTLGISAPFIPFDLRYRYDSNVYYRYGAFKNFELKNDDGTLTLAIFDPKGNLVADNRDNKTGKPEWVLNPLVVKEKKINPHKKNPLQTTYKIFTVLSQRGKGGVYLAIDLSSQIPRLCVIKEGRKNGEANWFGMDGYDYVKREAEILDELKSIGIGLPSKYTSFELDDNFYLVSEYIKGESLQKLLIKRKCRLSIKKVLEYSCKIASLIARLHAVGWVWHDCKPSNIIISRNGDLRLLDFEGACRKNEKNHLVWGTDDFLPLDWSMDLKKKSTSSLDLFALGSVIYYLLCGRYYLSDKPINIYKLRRNVPLRLQKIVSALLDQNPGKRPSAKVVARLLQNELKLIN